MAFSCFPSGSALPGLFQRCDTTRYVAKMSSVRLRTSFNDHSSAINSSFNFCHGFMCSRDRNVSLDTKKNFVRSLSLCSDGMVSATLTEGDDLNECAGQKQFGGKGNFDDNDVMNFHFVLCVSVTPPQEVDLVLLRATTLASESQNNRRYEAPCEHRARRENHWRQRLRNTHSRENLSHRRSLTTEAKVAEMKRFRAASTDRRNPAPPPQRTTVLQRNMSRDGIDTCCRFQGQDTHSHNKKSGAMNPHFDVYPQRD